MTSHSGYAVPGLGDPLAHDWHHETFNECFGVLGVLDTLHNTNTNFMTAMKLGHGTTMGVSRRDVVATAKQSPASVLDKISVVLFGATVEGAHTSKSA